MDIEVGEGGAEANIIHYNWSKHLFFQVYSHLLPQIPLCWALIVKILFQLNSFQV